VIFLHFGHICQLSLIAQDNSLLEPTTVDLTVVVMVVIASGHGARRQLKILQSSAAPVGGSVVDVSVVRSDISGHRRRGDEDALEAPVAGIIATRDCSHCVLGLGVTPEINLALERSRADAARERFEPGVLATVRDEVRRLTKGFSTLTTNIRLLTCIRYNRMSLFKILLKEKKMVDLYSATS